MPGAGMLQARSKGCEPGLLHHADWVASLLHGRHTCTDWHNAARLGYDAAAGAYPPWLLAQASQCCPAYVVPVLMCVETHKSYVTRCSCVHGWNRQSGV